MSRNGRMEKLRERAFQRGNPLMYDDINRVIKWKENSKRRREERLRKRREQERRDGQQQAKGSKG